MKEATMDNNPIFKLLFLHVESMQMTRAKSSSNDKLQPQTNEHNNRNTIPKVKTAGNKCTIFNDSGYFLYRLMRAMPELCTCLKNFFKPVRRLCHTHASGNSRQALKYAQKALQIKETDKIESLGQNFLVLGEIYYNLPISDSAYYYFNKALHSSSIYTVRAAYQGLYYVSRDNHEYEKMSVYCDQLLNYQDSIQTLNKSSELAEMQKEYDQQKIINEKNQLEIDKKNMINMILLAGIGIVVGIAVMIYIYIKKNCFAKNACSKGRKKK